MTAQIARRCAPRRLAYYFLEGPAPASDIKVSPDGRYALVIHAQQLYLVALPEDGGAAEKPIDLSLPDKRVRRLTTVGADFSAWSDDGKSITWTLGSTFSAGRSRRLRPVPPARGPRRRRERPVETYEARVELPRDTPTGAAGSCVVRPSPCAVTRSSRTRTC